MNVRALFMAVIAWIPLLYLSGCVPEGEDVDTTPPAQPILKPRSVDSLYAETGIRPEAVTDARNYWIRIEWYRNPEEDLKGYAIYRRGENESDFPETPIGQLIIGQNLSPTAEPYFVDRDTWNLQPNDTTGDTRGYWYAVRAYDQVGNTSEFSQSAYYRLIWNPRNFDVTDPSPGVHYLEWTYESGPEVIIDYYMIRVWDEETAQPMWWMKYTEFSSAQRLLLNADGSAQPFVSGRTYVWKLSVIANSQYPTRAPAGSAVKTTFVY